MDRIVEGVSPGQAVSRDPHERPTGLFTSSSDPSSRSWKTWPCGIRACVSLQAANTGHIQIPFPQLLDSAMEIGPPATENALQPQPSPGASGVGVGKTWREPLTGMELVWVPSGCYQRGCGR